MLFKEPVSKQHNVSIGLTQTQDDLLHERLKYLFPNTKQNLGVYIRGLILGDLNYWKKTIYSPKNKIKFTKINDIPERYDIILDGLSIANSKLSNGNLMVYINNSNRSIFDEAIGNNEKNINEFYNKEEREFWLNKIAKKIINLKSDLGVSEIPEEGN